MIPVGVGVGKNIKSVTGDRPREKAGTFFVQNAQLTVTDPNPAERARHIPFQETSLL